MKHITTIVLIALSFCLNAQEYPFTNDYAKATIFLNDSTRKTGELNWFPNPNERLKFREHGATDTKKYSPQDIVGFSSGRYRFVSLHGLDLYTANYGLTGKTTHIKHSFGELIDSGEFSIYLVIETGYDAIAGGVRAYPNYVFEKTETGVHQYAAFPVGVRMREKRYEQAKTALYDFFKNYPDITDKIKNYRPQDNFLEIIIMMKGKN